MKLANISEAAHAPLGNHRASCPACNHGPRDGAVSITVTGPGTYVWYCHRCNSAGASGRDSYRVNQLPPQVVQRNHEGLASWALDLWKSTRSIAGEALEYLQARNCAIPPNDGDLRWHPNLRHPSGYVGAALVALITNAVTGKAISVHRTWILPGGTKAPVEDPRMLAKGHRKAGGVIRLWPDDAVTNGLGIGEGIETTLSLAHGYTPTWSCIDAGNLNTFPVLEGIDSVVIAVDGDMPGMRAAHACAERWLDAGREVTVVKAPPGQDLNNVAQAA